MNRESAQAWLDAYVRAWISYEPEEIDALFTEDVAYRFHPWDPPVRGREAVVEAWKGEGGHEGAPDRDEPGTYRGTYAPTAIDGDVVVATGSTTYTEPSGAPGDVYDNCFVIRFDSSGLCSEFTEYFMLRPTE